MRAGVKGGLIVTAPDAASVRRPATLFLDHADVTPENLLEVRAAIELSCVRLASERVSPDTATRISRRACDLIRMRASRGRVRQECRAAV